MSGHADVAGCYPQFFFFYFVLFDCNIPIIKDIIIEKSKEIKQNWTRAEKFDNCF